MTVTLANARATVRSMLDETSPQFWTNTMLNRWLNQAAEDMARQSQSLWMQSTIAAVLTQQNYNLPSNFLGIHRVTFSPSTSDQTYNLEFRGIMTMDEIWGILHQLPAAYPQAYFLWNDTGSAGGGMYMGIYPVPAVTGNFTVYYYRAAVVAATDAALLDVTPGYEDVAFEYAIYKAKRRDRDPTWQTAKALYDQMLQNMIDKTRRFSDQGDVFTDGSPQWPIYAYVGTDSGW